MSDHWLKPDFQEFGVSGECTAYAGTQGASEANNHGILTVDPLKTAEKADARSSSGHGGRRRLPPVELRMPQL